MKVYRINPKASTAGILVCFCRQARDGLDGTFEFEVVHLHAVIEVDFEALLGEGEDGVTSLPPVITPLRSAR